MFKTIVTATILLTSLPLLADIKTRTIQYKQGDTTLTGYLAYDDALKGPRPGILVAPEWWGLNDYAKSRADQLAKLGYIALAIDMYGQGKSVNKPDEAGALAKPLLGNRPLMRQRAQAALDTLKSQPNVDSKKIAAIGYCFGGTVVLELARSGADLVGVVGFHCNLNTPNPADAKNIKGKVLVCEGGDDSFVPPEQVAAFEKEMRDAHVNWQLNFYGGAVHAFTNPKADDYHIPGIAYNPQADARSWDEMKMFFNEVFK